MFCLLVFFNLTVSDRVEVIYTLTSRKAYVKLFGKYERNSNAYVADTGSYGLAVKFTENGELFVGFNGELHFCNATGYLKHLSTLGYRLIHLKRNYKIYFVC